MVSVAVAFPFVSKVTEFGLSEQAGAACAGCTEQASATGLSNAFSRFSVTVEVALWPRLTVGGLGADAEIEKSVPAVFSSTLIVLSPFVTITSGDLSPLISDAATEVVSLLEPTLKLTDGWKVPSPFPKRTYTASAKPMARSEWPSPLKSAIAADVGTTELAPNPVSIG